MTYQTIYGHESPIAFLKRAVTSGKAAHAFIFSGPEGVGKRTVALAFAASLLCPVAPSSGEGCGNCPSCRRVQHDKHPDLVTIVPTGAMIRIQDIRDMIRLTTIHPMESAGRVILIDDADRMNEQAANALLKTLEEPNPRNTFILVTARAYKLPATIQSRCQRVTFSPLTKDALARFLMEKHGMEESQAALLAASAAGSVSRALYLAREEYLTFRETLSSLLRSGITSHSSLTLGLSSLLSSDKVTIEDQLDLLGTVFRDALWLKETGIIDGLMNREYTDIITLLAEKLSTVELIENIRLLTDTMLSLEQNVNRSLTLDATLFRLRVP